MRLVEIVLGDDGDAWRRAGFAVDGDGCFEVGGVGFCCTGEGDGIVRWSLAVEDPVGRAAAVDGLPTSFTAQDEPSPTRRFDGHVNGASLLDHVVLSTPDRQRTLATFAHELGLQPRREVEHVLGDKPMVQSFFLLAPTMIELLSPPTPPADASGPTSFWGLAFVVSDLDATVAQLGQLCSPAKDAVQPGRRIASLRGPDVGLTVPVAFLTPRH